MNPAFRLLALFTSLAVASCAAAPPAHLRMLNALPTVSPATIGKQTIKLTILPVSVAEYLDRAELVRRSSTNEIALSSDDVWAERLSSMMGRVLAADLTGLIPADVSTVTTIGESNIAGQISLDVTGFEIDASGVAVLSARWSLIDPTTHQTLVSEPLGFTSPGGGGTQTSAVAAMNRAFDQAAERMATVIRAQIGAGRLKPLS